MCHLIFVSQEFLEGWMSLIWDFQGFLSVLWQSRREITHLLSGLTWFRMSSAVMDCNVCCVFVPLLPLSFILSFISPSSFLPLPGWPSQGDPRYEPGPTQGFIPLKGQFFRAITAYYHSFLLEGVVLWLSEKHLDSTCSCHRCHTN